VLIDPAERDWSTEDDSTVWHAAGDGIPQAKAELRRREAQHRVGRMSPSAKAAMVSRARNGRS
jgi:hypothetical protein